MAIYFTKVSGVVRIATDSDVPRIYFSPIGKATPNPNGTDITLQIGGDSFTMAYTDMVVNGQIPSTQRTGITLLNSIFGT